MRSLIVPPLALLAAFAFTQSTQVGEPTTRPRQVAQQGADAPVKLGVDLVVMDAQVVEKDTGKIVGGLKKTDFVLYEDGTKQEIADFGQDSLPLSVILLVDRAGCLDPIDSNVRGAVLLALKQFKPTDEVALMAFADQVELVKGFTLNRDAIAAAWDRIPEHQEDAEHCLNVALYEAADYMKQASNPYGRRVIVFITGITRGVDCDGPSGKDALQEIYESGAVVCALLPRSAGQRMENGMTIGAVGMIGVFGVPTTNLSKVAEETGGEIISANDAELNHSFETLVEHLRTRYSLGFVSTNTKFDGSFRKLKLELSPEAQKRVGKKTVVRTRKGYIATPPRPAP
jgi:VWFA-related protein